MQGTAPRGEGCARGLAACGEPSLQPGLLGQQSVELGLQHLGELAQVGDALRGERGDLLGEPGGVALLDRLALGGERPAPALDPVDLLAQPSQSSMPRAIRARIAAAVRAASRRTTASPRRRLASVTAASWLRRPSAVGPRWPRVISRSTERVTE